MPEVGDHYEGAEILLPGRDQITRGHVVARIRDINGNLMGRSHTKWILDTRTDQVEFTGGKDTELTANVIEESVYAQGHSEGNEYLLLQMLLDNEKENKAISLSDHQITIRGRPVTRKTTVDWQICCQ